MADETAFQVIRDAIVTANRDQSATANPADTADDYARAVLVALEHSGFEIVRHNPEPPDVD